MDRPSGMVVPIAVNSITFYYIVAAELNYSHGYFNDLIELLQLYSQRTPLEEVTRVRSGVSIDPTQ